MSPKNKIIVLRYLISFIIFIVAWFLLDLAFENLQTPYKGMISAVVMVILSPRVKEYDTQSGKQYQLKWIFFKKAISI